MICIYTDNTADLQSGEQSEDGLSSLIIFDFLNEKLANYLCNYIKSKGKNIKRVKWKIFKRLKKKKQLQEFPGSTLASQQQCHETTLSITCSMKTPIPAPTGPIQLKALPWQPPELQGQQRLRTWRGGRSHPGHCSAGPPQSWRMKTTWKKCFPSGSLSLSLTLWPVGKNFGGKMEVTYDLSQWATQMGFPSFHYELIIPLQQGPLFFVKSWRDSQSQLLRERSWEARIEKGETGPLWIRWWW